MASNNGREFHKNADDSQSKASNSVSVSLSVQSQPQSSNTSKKQPWEYV